MGKTKLRLHHKKIKHFKALAKNDNTQSLLIKPKLLDVTPREIVLIFWRRAKQTTDALHNSGFLFPVAREQGCGCFNLQNSIERAAADGQSNDLYGVLLDLSNLHAYKISELKF